MTPVTPLDRVRVVLVRPVHPGNIGAAARALKTMGLARLVLVAPERFPDPQAQAMASGAQDVLAQARVCASLDEALAGATLALATTSRPRELANPVLNAREAAARLAAEADENEVALVFGNETSGLTTAEVSRCPLLATIPASPAYPSLNLAAAVQVMAYELRLAALGAAAPAERRFEPATLEEVERFYQHLEQALRDTGYLDPKQPKRLMLRLRRLFSRTRLEKEEIAILRGILNTMAK